MHVRRRLRLIPGGSCGDDVEQWETQGAGYSLKQLGWTWTEHVVIAADGREVKPRQPTKNTCGLAFHAGPCRCFYIETVTIILPVCMSGAKVCLSATTAERLR